MGCISRLGAAMFRRPAASAESLPGETTKSFRMHLHGMTEMSAEDAKGLATLTRGDLCLDGLKSLSGFSQEAAEALAQHEGGLVLGVTLLSGDAVAVLRANPHISLPDKFSPRAGDRRGRDELA